MIKMNVLKEKKIAKGSTRRFLTIMICVILTLFLPAGCTSLANVVSIEETGNVSPGGTLGTVLLVKEKLEAGYVGMKVHLTVSNFGRISDGDVQSVTEELVKHARMKSNVGGSEYTEKQYYYTYYSDVFKKDSFCRIDLYYFVKPEAVNKTLKFEFDYTTSDGKQIRVEQKCDNLKKAKQSGSEIKIN